MLGLVSVRYYNPPTILLYHVESDGPNGVHSYKDNFSLVDKGVLPSLQSIIRTLFSKSQAYLSWVRMITSRV